jgi:rubredoxin
VANVVAFDDVKATRTQRVVDGGKFAWRTNFMQPDAEDRTNPQAFLAECSAERVLRTHFHDHDQFQIFVSGGGTNAKHPIAPFQVHFSRKHTPYGPIIANEAGCGFLTLRAQRDPGAQYLPENLEKLKSIPGRTPWQHSENVVFPKPTGAVAVQPIETIKDDRGLAAHAISVKPNAEGTAPDPSNSNGQYIVVLGGSLMYEGKEHKATTIIWVKPEEGAFKLTAGAEGLEAVALHFPKPELPITQANPSLADVESDGEYKVWSCVLCAFVYDEAEGLPEEGIAPGTRWKDVPESWGCPDCSAKKADFEMVEF